MADSHLLRLHDVTRRDVSTGRAILDRVTLSIDGGERVGLAGRSGSGKSSLLRVIARLDGMDEGTVLFGGVAIDKDDVPRFRREVVYLPQRPALFPQTVRENLQMPFRLAVADRPYDEAVAASFLDAFGRSAAMLDQTAESLSGGEQQIVAMIRALAVQPIVLLCDEPTASLDPDTAERFEKIVLDRQRDSVAAQDAEKSFIWTSHNPDQMSRMASRVVRMDAGRLLEGEER